MSKAPNRTSVLTGVAGEYYVAAELSRMVTSPLLLLGTPSFVKIFHPQVLSLLKMAMEKVRVIELLMYCRIFRICVLPTCLEIQFQWAVTQYQKDTVTQSDRF